MSEQDSFAAVAAGEVNSNSDSPTRDWYEAHRTTPEEREANAWAAERTRSLEVNKKLEQALGQDSGAYKRQLESMTLEERESLAKESPESILATLDTRADADKQELKRKEEEKRLIEGREEASFAANETPALSNTRRAMKKAYQEATSLDERIAELQQLNELRDDISDDRWDDLPADTWIAAREGNLESVDGKLAALIQEKQAKLQEAALHQSAYHESLRGAQAPPRGYSEPDRPVGQLTGANGHPVQITRADIDALVQNGIDEQAHAQRMSEAAKHYADWNEVWVNARKTISNGGQVPLPSANQIAFIKTLPNSADVAYHLMTHHNETRAIAGMNNNNAVRALMSISHQLARGSAPTAKQQTSAPKPPSPVNSGGHSGVWDVNDESGTADEWVARRYADLRRRGKA